MSARTRRELEAEQENAHAQLEHHLRLRDLLSDFWINAEGPSDQRVRDAMAANRRAVGRTAAEYARTTNALEDHIANKGGTER